MRFPEFEGEWETTKLGTNCNVLMCKRILAAQTNTTTGIPFYKIGTIGDVPDVYISKELFELYREKYNYPKVGEVLITCAGTVGKCLQFDGKDAYFQDSNIVWIDNPCQKIKNSFLYRLLLNVDWSKLNSTTITRIYNDNLRDLKLVFPQSDEQDKITNFLTLIDQRLSTQNKIIESLESLIKGLNRTLFKFGNECKKIKLGDLCSITTGKLDANAMVKDGLYPFFTCAEQVYRINSFAFNTEALLISGNGANVGYINYYKGKFNAYQRTYVLSDFKENIQYIRYYLKAYLHTRIGQEKNVGNTPYIVLNTLSDMWISFPSQNRQNQIVAILATLNKKLQIEKSLLEQLNSQKRFLLSQMFI